MINLKSKEEIKKMKQGGIILSSVLYELLKNIRPGVSELEIDKLAEKLIKEKGAEPGFKKVEGYNHSICVSTNNSVVHGIPTNYKFKKGDVVGIDCGIFYEGFHTDMAETIRVSTDNRQQTTNNKKDKIDEFLNTGKKALNDAIRMVKAGNRVGHISRAIQTRIEGEGYSVVRSLVGHGVGRKLHEEPEIPGYLTTKISKTPLLIEGMTIAVEAIYNMGKSDVVLSREDNWTIRTADGSISGLFERTVLVTKKGPVVLTQLPSDKQVVL
ncbi:MAG: type I methionyl aminopeptidase [Candidatus Pacearchaeota archaeon]